MSGNAVSVLIVEDDRIVAKDLQQTLSDFGYDAYGMASSAEEAVAKASKRCPDVALVDVGLKGTINGIDAAAILRSRFGVPIVYLTAHHDDATIERTKTSEPFGFVLKPVKAIELRRVIELALHRQEAEAQLRARQALSPATARSVASAADVEPRPKSDAPAGRSTRRSTVLLADDHAVVREGLAKLLTDYDFDVVGTVGDETLLLDAAKRHRPDVIVTDISMPGLSGLEVLAKLKAERIDSKVIVLTMHNDADMATRAVRSGASGFLLKQSAGDELVKAIHQALQGRFYLATELTKDVMERLAAPPAESEPTLTARQLDVLRLILKGCTAKEIAAVLNLSPRTVETHKYEIMRVLGVDSTTALVRYAIEHRLIVD